MPDRGLLISRGEKGQILRDFQGQIHGKIGRFCGIFAGIFEANFAEKQSIKYGAIAPVAKISIYSIWFLANFATVCVFLWISRNLRIYLTFAAPRPRKVSEALLIVGYKSCTFLLPLLPQLHYIGLNSESRGELAGADSLGCELTDTAFFSSYNQCTQL